MSIVRKIKKSDKYKGVREIHFLDSGIIKFCTELTIKGFRYRSYHKTEKAAAIWYDLKRIENNLSPINILKNTLI